MADDMAAVAAVDAGAAAVAAEAADQGGSGIEGLCRVRTSEMPEWIVSVDELAGILKSELESGAIPDDVPRPLNEQLIDQLDGLRIEIFSREHPPPHFRVSYQGETNNFDICSGEPLKQDGLSKYHRKIRKWHRANRDLLVNAWNERRPADCPVGEVQC
jgi:hypothetical protein